MNQRYHMLWVLIGAICYTLLFVTGIKRYTFGLFDHSFLLPILQHIEDPSSYPSDIMLQAASGYSSLFLHLLVWIKALFDCDYSIIFAVLYFLTVSLSFFVFGKLIIKAGASLLHVFAGFSLLAIYQYLPGGFELIPATFLLRTAALPLVLCALFFAFTKNSLISALCVAFATLIHPLSGLYTGLFIAVYIWISDSFKSTLTFGIAPVITIILLLLISPLKSDISFFPQKEWLSILFMRSSHHISPLSWSWELILRYVSLLLLFQLTQPSSVVQQLKKPMWVFSLMLSLVALSVYFIPIRFVIQLSPTRAFTLPMIISIFGLASAIGSSMRNNVLVAIALFVLIGNSLSFLNPWGYWVTGVAIALFVGAYFFKRMSLSLAPAIVICWFFGIWWKGYQLFPKFNYQSAQQTEWISLQTFVKNNTDKESLVIVPPETEGFRLNSLRSSYGDYKDGALVFYSLDYAKQWKKRMETLGVAFNAEGVNSDYKNLTYTELQRVFLESSEPFDAGYAIVYKNQYEGSHVLFETTNYALISL